MNHPVFVVGAQRSGTTLLCTMLNQLPSLYMANELPWDTYDYLLEASADIQPLADYLRPDRRFTDFDVTTLKAAPASRWAFFEQALTSYATGKGKPHWGIKDPHLTPYLAAFAQQFPAARFIVIIRDARAVVASMLRHTFHVANSYYGAALWRENVDTQLRFAETFPDVTLTIHYEALLSTPQTVLKEICRLIDTPYDEALLTRPQKTDIKLNHFNENVYRPLDPSKLESWKRELSAKQISVVESMAADLLERLGYEATRPRKVVGPVARTAYRIHQKVVAEYRWQRERRLRPMAARLKRAIFGQPKATATT